jgi:hypothetical protein
MRVVDLGELEGRAAAIAARPRARDIGVVELARQPAARRRAALATVAQLLAAAIRAARRLAAPALSHGANRPCGPRAPSGRG